LVIKDEYSGLVYIAPTERADADSAMEVLAFYMSFTCVPKMIRSDGGSHFVNGTIDGACKLLGIKHHVTTPYMSFSNGSVERVNRDLKALLQIVQRSLDVDFEAWPSFLPFVMQVINNTRAERLGDKTPKQIYMGLEPEDPFGYIFIRDTKEFSKVPMDSDEYLRTLNALSEELELMHKPLLELKGRKRDLNNRNLVRSKLLGKRRSRYADNGLNYREVVDEDLDVHEYFSKEELRKLKVMFQVGDYVMVATPEKRIGNKLISRWSGPLRIIEEVNPWVYKVQHLVTEELQLSHATRMKFYCDKDLEVTVELKDLVNKDGKWLHKYNVEKLVGHKFDDNDLEWKAIVQWQGFSSGENTEESFMSLNEDVPKMLDEYVRRLDASGHEDAGVLKLLLKDLRGDSFDAGNVAKKRKNVPQESTGSVSKKRKTRR
jgi:hypothetical protein